jgi:nucleotide-binding universal stress UspA family protein
VAGTAPGTVAGVEAGTAPGTAAGVDAPVVVGVDGSAESVTALRWAAREAELRGSPLRVVHAWNLDVPAHSELLPRAAPALAQQGWRTLEESIVRALGTRAGGQAGRGGAAGRGAGGRISSDVVIGGPALMLLRESRTARLLVLGPRGRGGFPDLALGSVAAQCVEHARCPVAVIR